MMTPLARADVGSFIFDRQISPSVDGFTLPTTPSAVGEERLFQEWGLLFGCIGHARWVTHTDRKSVVNLRNRL
jgi:hypothetical protein